MSLPGSVGLQAHFTLRAAAAELSCRFYVRTIWPLWTDRETINGVIELDNDLLGDAKLEYVISGVMDDIKGILDVNEVDYIAWTDITKIPVLIKRAVTYGVVSSLYARHSKTWSSRFIPSMAPVTITVIGDDERAMQFWEGRMDKAIERYLSTIGATVIAVTTISEEPIFSMVDIPPTWIDEDVLEWQEFLNMRRST